ncbi:MAG TPA: hypothetical protein VIL74_14410 [Pyrinomonadaceae bacterium]|jgi:hypothetical protein
MPTQWNPEIRETKQLKVYNMGGGWSAAVNAGIASFNNLGFGVKLVTVKEKEAANIVVMLSDGSDSYTWGDHTITVNFNAERLHGKARTIATGGKTLTIDFAVVFLPGKVRKPTPKQKEAIVVHELIHASGLNGLTPAGVKLADDDHDQVGIMVAQLVEYGDGVMEMLPEKGATKMTPVRVGGQTMCKMRMLWSSGPTC